MFCDESAIFYLQGARSPKEIASATQTALQQVIQAINYIDEVNIPTPLDGATILKNYSVNLKKLTFSEWAFPLFKMMPAASTTSTSGLDGGYFYFDPAKFPANGGKWYLEAVLQVTSGGTATLYLRNGANNVGSVTSTATSWSLVRSSALTMPTSGAVLTCRLQTSSTSYTAYCIGASLIYVP